MDINIEVQEPQELTPIEISVSTGASYPILDDKPQINGVELVGNKTAEDLGLQPKGDYISRGEINIDGSISGDGFATKEELNKKANKSELSTVAFSGSYNDLKNRPTIPTVPTKTSQLTNDSGFLTQHQDISYLATKTELTNKQDKLVAGNNITIVNNVISATGGNSSGGSGGSQSSPWVLSHLALVSSSTTISDTGLTFDVSDYLPKDGLTYLVYANVRAITPTSNNASIVLYAFSDLTESKYRLEFLSEKNHSSSEGYASGMVLIPVGADRTVGLMNSSKATGCKINYFRLIMYQQVTIEGSVL